MANQSSFKLLSLSPLASALCLALTLPIAQVRAANLLVESSIENDEDEVLSLNEALYIASDNDEDDTITFSSSLEGQTLSMNGYSFYYDDGNDVTINGAVNESRITINAQGQGNLIQVYYDSTLTLSNLDISFANISGSTRLVRSQESNVSLTNVSVNGAANESTTNDRRAIYAYSANVTLQNVSITNMSANNGNVIEMDYDGDLTINDSTISDNGHGNHSNSRSIIDVSTRYNDLSVYINNSTFDNNKMNYADSNDGTVLTAYAYGNLYISITQNSTFSNNQNTDEEGNGGSAVFAEVYGDDGSYNADITVSDSTFSGNTGGSNGALGVRIDNAYGNTSTLYIDNTNLDENTSVSGASALMVDASYAELEIDILNSEFTDNAAYSYEESSAISLFGNYYSLTVDVSETTISGNSSEMSSIKNAAGLSIYFDGDYNNESGVLNATFTEVTFENNVTMSKSGYLSGVGALAVYVKDNDYSDSLTISDSIFTGNSGDTGALRFYAADAYEPSLTISGTTFEENIGEHGGSAVDVESNTTYGFNLTIEDSFFNQNGNEDSQAAALEVYSYEDYYLNILIGGTQISENQSSGDAKAAGINIETDDVYHSSLTILDSVIIENESSGQFSTGGMSVFLEGSNNNSTSSISMTGTVIAGNTGDAVGGMLLYFDNFGSNDDESSGSDGLIENTSIVGNEGAETAGLSINFSDSLNRGFEILHSTIASNNLSGDAETGGLRLRASVAGNTVKPTIINSIISQNDLTGGKDLSLYGEYIEALAAYSIIGSTLALNDADLDEQLSLEVTVSNADPKLGVLDNDADIPRVCLLEGSPAIDAGVSSSVRNDLDQIGNSRIDDDAPDLGIIEYIAGCEEVDLPEAEEPEEIETENETTNTVKKKKKSSGSLGFLALFSLLPLLRLRRKQKAA